MSNVRLGCVVIHYGSIAQTLRCLSSLERQAIDSPTRICVVDNALDPDARRAIAHSHPDADVVVPDRNLGFAGGCNLGARRLQETGFGDYFLFINNDAVCDGESVLETLLTVLQSAPDLALVGPEVVDGGTGVPLQTWLPSIPTTLREVLNRTHARAAGNGAAGHYISGACWMVRGVAYRLVGGLDERYFMYIEDCDLCRCLVAAGFRIAIAPNARILHFQDSIRSITPSTFRFRHAYLNKARYLVKYGASPLLRLMLIASAVRIGLVSVWRHRAVTKSVSHELSELARVVTAMFWIVLRQSQPS